MPHSTTSGSRLGKQKFSLWLLQQFCGCLLWLVPLAGTFSSGMLNAFDWQQRTNAVLVGEPTGGKPNGYGEVRDFFLPNSNLRVVHSTRLFQILPGDPPSLFPSINIAPMIEEYLAGRDPVLELVLRP